MFTSERGAVMRGSTYRPRVFNEAVQAVQRAATEQRAQELATTGVATTPEFPTVSPHDLRHTAANKLLEQGTRFLFWPRFLVGRRARRSAWQSAAVTFGLKCNDKAISSSEINLRGH